jgi:sugar O-acyltransferase (sialic acid O-acetyltransferase NeuD family)
MKKAIIGAGGFGKEVFWSLDPIDRKKTVFFVSDEYWENSNSNTLPLSVFDEDKYEVVVAIGDPFARKLVIESLPLNTKFFTHIHPSVQILGDDVEIGIGSIICSGCILTSNINIGKHAHLNLHTTVGHDTRIGDFFTSSPGVKISGNCNIGDRVYFGTNSSIKEKINVCDDVTLGLNAGVLENIYVKGVYVGTPCKKIK